MAPTLSEEQVAILNVLLKAKPKLRQELLKHADKELVRTICECVLNVLEGNIAVPPPELKKLSKHKKLLRRIVQKACNWKQKRVIIQKGGNFLIPLLAPILGAVISKIF